MTDNMTNVNVATVRTEISKIRQEDNLYRATSDSILPVLNDMDHHPYTRFFRGVYYYPDPVIMEREAGWRPQEEACYGLQIPPKRDVQPNHCYQSACSTVYPCYPEYLEKDSDKPLLDTLLNKACIVQYR